MSNDNIIDSANKKQKWLYSKFKLLALIGFPLLFISMLNSDPMWSLTQLQWRVVALTLLMIGWWVSEAVPVPVTSLLPIIMFPALGVGDMKTSAAPYSSPCVFLYMGGFMLAIAIEQSKLHLRIALSVIKLIGTNANGIIGGFLLATSLLSMWMSNTATVVMMLPICLSVINLLIKNSDVDGSNNRIGNENFAATLMLAIGFGASIGGVGTVIGTPTNTIFANYMQETYNYEVGFSQWMFVGVLFMIIMIYISWICLIKIYPNNLGSLENAKQSLSHEFDNLGKMSRAEKLVATVFLITALSWSFRNVINKQFDLSLRDEAIALIAGISLFIIPVNLKAGKFLLNWKTAETLPWGVLLLFGGGLSIAESLEKSGIVNILGHVITGNLSNFALISVATLIALVVTQFMGNMSLITILLPVLTSISIAYEINPILVALPATIAASCSFCLPVSTPPNAIIFASGYLKISHMIKAGAVISVISGILIILITRYIVPIIFKFNVFEFPDWARIVM